jgi:LuxR family maltose regulon positive regulatory protein
MLDLSTSLDDRRKENKKEISPGVMIDLPVPIIRSKLYSPPMAADTVRRVRLLSLAQTVADVPLTLVSAPAGYGKSTLASQWLGLVGCRSAWLSLDPADSDLTQFLSYVIAAVRSTLPGCLAETAEILRSATLTSADELAGMFCNEIEALTEPIALVLDDYHQISSSAIDDFLDAVLKHPPRNLHLIVVTRRDPGLSIPALRARGTLCEVRMQQLEFREDETRAFIRANLGDAITDDEIGILQERTEGWPAALRLARLAAGEQGATTSVVNQLPDDSHAIRTYLMQEVLANQSIEIREYLLRAAFLDRFCPELCDAVMPERNTEVSARSFLIHINQANLFSIALDESGNWYRFHHLFQSMLQDQAVTDLGNEEVRDIHMRASKWFEEHEFLADAIKHALSANCPGEAADVISRHRNMIMNHERWHQLGIWLRLLPPQIVASRPEFQLLKARIFRTTGQNAELVQTLDAADSLLDTAVIDDGIKKELYGSLASMRCYQFYAQSDGEAAIRAARQALELLPPDDLAERGFAMILLGAALQMTGDVKGAIDNIYSAISEASAQGEDRPTYMTRLLAALCYVYWMDADLKELDLVAKDTERLGRRADLWEVLSVALHFIASCHYHQNRLSAIDDVLRDLLHKKAIASPELYAHSLIILALAQEALGNTDDALNTSGTQRDLAFRTQNPYMIGLSEALAAELAIRQGRMADALKWASQYEPEPLVPVYCFFAPPLCLAKILVLDDTAGSRKRAQALLPRLEDYFSWIHNKRFLVETLALRALLSDKTGDTALATEQLGRAVSMAQPGGFIRLFVDIGPDLMPLLNRLELDGEKLEYVGHILAAFRSEGVQTGKVQANKQAGATVNNIAGLPEHLSPREQEVLALLAGRLTNKEIGERLFISTATVKRHAHNIYEKLNVKGRREAVAKAVGLGLTAD